MGLARRSPPPCARCLTTKRSLVRAWREMESLCVCFGAKKVKHCAQYTCLSVRRCAGRKGRPSLSLCLCSDSFGVRLSNSSWGPHWSHPLCMCTESPVSCGCVPEGHVLATRSGHGAVGTGVRYLSLEGWPPVAVVSSTPGAVPVTLVLSCSKRPRCPPFHHIYSRRIQRALRQMILETTLTCA